MFEPIHRRTLSIPPASRDQFVHTHKDAISLSLTRCLDAAARKHKVGQNRFYGPCSSDRAAARSFPVECRESRSFLRSVGLIADIRYRPSNTAASPRIVCSIVGIGVRSGLAAGGNRDSNSRSLRRRREGSRATRDPFRGAPHGFLHAPVRAVGFFSWITLPASVLSPNWTAREAGEDPPANEHARCDNADQGGFEEQRQPSQSQGAARQEFGAGPGRILVRSMLSFS